MNNNPNNGNQQQHPFQYGGVTGDQNDVQQQQSTVNGQPQHYVPAQQHPNTYYPQNRYVFQLNNVPLNQNSSVGYCNYGYTSSQPSGNIQNMPKESTTYMDASQNPPSGSQTFHQMQNVPYSPSQGQRANRDRLVPTDNTQGAHYGYENEFAGNHLNEDDYNNLGSIYLMEGGILGESYLYRNNEFVDNAAAYEEPLQQPYPQVELNHPIYEQQPYPPAMPQMAPANPLEFNMDRNVAANILPPPAVHRPARRGRGRPRLYTAEERRIRHIQSCNEYNARREAERAALRDELVQLENDNAGLQQEFEHLEIQWDQMFAEHFDFLTPEERNEIRRRIFEIQRMN